MSKAIEFKLDKPALTAFLKGPEVSALLNEAAAKIATAAGDEGYEVEPAHPIQWVSIASVYANTYDSYYDALENKTLETAAKGVRI